MSLSYEGALLERLSLTLRCLRDQAVFQEGVKWLHLLVSRMFLFQDVLFVFPTYCGVSERDN